MPQAAVAGPRPFRLVEHGNLTVTPRDASGTVLDVVAEGVGTATHLGVITVERTATLTATSSPGIFDFNGQATLTAASGEKLTSTITGTLNANVGHADLIYQWTGGTGRFEHARGSAWSNLSTVVIVGVDPALPRSFCAYSAIMVIPG